MKNLNIQKYKITNAKRDLPVRSASSNKTAGGKIYTVAGSKGMWGAAVLSATASVRSGAGYVYIVSNSKGFPTVKHPDFLLSKKIDFLKASAVVIGPGLKGDSFIKSSFRKLLRTDIPVLVDAEALNVLSKMKLKKPLPLDWVLTPHEGELARLIDKSSDSIRKDRKRALLEAQKKWGGTIVLKGHKTLISDGLQLFEIQSGNPALAKAGTGDVLSGMIGALLSQKISAIKAAGLGAFVHGYIADQWLLNKKDILSLMASDILDEIPSALYKIRGH